MFSVALGRLGLTLRSAAFTTFRTLATFRACTAFAALIIGATLTAVTIATAAAITASVTAAIAVSARAARTRTVAAAIVAFFRTGQCCRGRDGGGRGSYRTGFGGLTAEPPENLADD